MSPSWITASADDEATTLLAFLDHFRAVLRRQADGLDGAQLDTRLPPSSLTLGALLKHLAYVESFWATEVLVGDEPGEPWRSADWDADPDWDLTSAAADPPDELRRIFDAEVAAAGAIHRRVLADGGLDALAARTRGDQRPNLRWILVHTVGEYARHCGHADLIRESIDGAEDL